MELSQALGVLWEAASAVRLTMKENEIVRVAYETLKKAIEPPPKPKDD